MLKLDLTLKSLIDFVLCPQWNDEKSREYLALRTCLKLRLLKAEVENTPTELQTLRWVYNLKIR